MARAGRHRGGGRRFGRDASAGRLPHRGDRPARPVRGRIGRRGRAGLGPAVAAGSGRTGGRPAGAVAVRSAVGATRPGGSGIVSRAARSGGPTRPMTYFSAGPGPAGASVSGGLSLARGVTTGPSLGAYGCTGAITRSVPALWALRKRKTRETLQARTTRTARTAGEPPPPRGDRTTTGGQGPRDPGRRGMGVPGWAVRTGCLDPTGRIGRIDSNRPDQYKPIRPIRLSWGLRRSYERRTTRRWPCS